MYLPGSEFTINNTTICSDQNPPKHYEKTEVYVTSLDNRGAIIRPFYTRSVNLTEMSKRKKHLKEMVSGS